VTIEARWRGRLVDRQRTRFTLPTSPPVCGIFGRDLPPDRRLGRALSHGLERPATLRKSRCHGTGRKSPEIAVDFLDWHSHFSDTPPHQQPEQTAADECAVASVGVEDVVSVRRGRFQLVSARSISILWSSC